MYSQFPVRRSDFCEITKVPYHVTFDLDLDLEHTLDVCHLETIMCMFGRDPPFVW